MGKSAFSNEAKPQLLLHGGRCSLAARETVFASIVIEDESIVCIAEPTSHEMPRTSASIDLRGYLVMPGLINAHDHLQYALYPRLGKPPYQNYMEWGEDIHRNESTVIAYYQSIARDVRLWWGGIRNLLCGVTTVCHHDRLWDELKREDFPVRVVQRYGWAHSVAQGSNLREAYAATPEDAAFILHACEGVDATAREEVFTLDRLGLLNAQTVLVHGLALDRAGVLRMHERNSSLILCPSSNHFLFAQRPQMQLFQGIEYIALGNDSPLTATGDLLDEVRYARHHCGIEADTAYSMVTEVAAKILRCQRGEGAIKAGGVADLIAIRDTGADVAEHLPSLSMQAIELVILGGRIQLASDTMRLRLPSFLVEGLEPLWIDGQRRWLRAPVADLLHAAEAVLGRGQVKMSGHQLATAPYHPASGTLPHSNPDGAMEA